jgi:hypothetical protein
MMQMMQRPLMMLMVCLAMLKLVFLPIPSQQPLFLPTLAGGADQVELVLDPLRSKRVGALGEL